MQVVSRLYVVRMASSRRRSTDAMRNEPKSVWLNRVGYEFVVSVILISVDPRSRAKHLV